MQTFITICGWLTVVLLCAAVLAFAVSLAADLCRRALERYRTALVLETRHALGREINSCSHWFSESPEAWTAIKVLGERLINGLGTDVERWREEWHERLRAERKSQGK